jgi:hypothetical protein
VTWTNLRPMMSRATSRAGRAKNSLGSFRSI